LFSQCSCYAMGWVTEEMFNSLQGQEIFLFSKPSTPALEPTQSPIQWVEKAVFPGNKSAGV
jgi:hypothetical protein